MKQDPVSKNKSKEKKKEIKIFKEIVTHPHLNVTQCMHAWKHHVPHKYIQFCDPAFK